MRIDFKKALLLGTAFVAVTSSLLPSYSFASSTSFENSSIDANDESMHNYINELQPYVKIHKDGTLYLAADYSSKTNIPNDIVNSITQWFLIVNEDVKSGNAYVNNNLEVIYRNFTVPVPESQFSAQLVNGGYNEIKTFWWGYELWLDNHTTNEIVSAIGQGAVATKLAEIIMKRVPIPQTKAINLVLELATLTLGGGAVILKTANQGNGIYITYARPVHPVTLALTKVRPQY